ncbi:unnamed protein product [Brachionus calyciflorus]|uniref:Ion transport domain-containing protein n=1 Tax=Brachionus calyciflorus TaxID=104777 RepID=A0A814BQ99_9BILA|nr:unnamed protein product [Brachionus calyciflorus]
MGNTTSDVNDSLKAQADSENGPDLYKLVNVNDGGELARLMKIAITTKNYSDVDNFIRTEVIKYLYNNGEGEDVPIEKIVMRRSGDKISKQIPGSNLMKHSDKKGPKTKRHCFNIDKTGAVGESLLHLCMLNGTPLFIDLAKRLIKIFPKMINDIYLSEDYFGETALHMAIVSEDPCMVKFLLLHGADVHEKCCGKFFCPEDQKNNQEHSLSQASPIFSLNTNYMGYAYFGEYPLSFAAILNQEECVRLLMATGADPNKQDFNGNTVLHMLVINNNLPMFKLMLEFNASLHIKNRQGLTPLTLAAKLARKEMFQFILERLRHVWFVYADVAVGSYPLETIDTIAEDGSTDTTSAIYLVVNGETEEHLELLEGFVVDLLNRKWNSYIKKKFYFEVVFFVIFMALSISMIIMKRLFFDYLSKEMNCTLETDNYTKLLDECKCAYLEPNDPNRFVRLIFEIFVLTYSVIYLIKICSELYIQSIKLYIETLLFNPSKVIFIFSLICYLLIIPMRFSCNYVGEDYLIIFSILFKCTYILYLGRGFRVITTFVYIIHRVIRTNFFRFIIIYMVFMMGFSQAFYILYGFGRPPVTMMFTSPLKALFDLLNMSIHDLSDAYDNLLLTEYAVVGRILFVIFLIIVSLLLINLLVAMMTHTYNLTTELKREWLRQWAKQVLTIEQNVTIKERLKQQKKYANTLSSGEKAFIVRWKLTKNEREDILSNKSIFQKNIMQSEEYNYVKDI